MGKEVHRIVAGIYEKHARTIEQIGGIPGDDFVRMNASCCALSDTGPTRSSIGSESAARHLPVQKSGAGASLAGAPHFAFT